MSPNKNIDNPLRRQGDSVGFADSEEIRQAESLAEKTVSQWDSHDRYRVNDADVVLFSNGREPNDVFVARQLLLCLSRMRLARSQYLGCGGQLKPDEVVDSIHKVLDGE